MTIVARSNTLQVEVVSSPKGKKTRVALRYLVCFLSLLACRFSHAAISSPNLWEKNQYIRLRMRIGVEDGIAAWPPGWSLCQLL